MGKRELELNTGLIYSVQIPLKYEHLFCLYFVRLSVGNATKCFATYGCCHPCYKYYLYQINVVVLSKYTSV